MDIREAYQILYSAVLCVLAVLIGIMLVRSVMGPRITDRIMSINMLSTMIIACIAILSRFLGEPYLVDAALIYAMISFTAVMMMATMYIPSKPKHPVFPGEETEGADTGAAEEPADEDVPGGNGQSLTDENGQSLTDENGQEGSAPAEPDPGAEEGNRERKGGEA